MTDTQTPDRIWAWEKQTTTRISARSTELGAERLWSVSGLPEVMGEIGATEYVRLDLHAVVVAERDEADRRAGAAERELGWLKDESRSRNQWLSEAKEKAGYEDHISFDRVFEDLLAAKEKLKALEEHDGKE